MLDTRLFGFMSIAFLMFLIYQAWLEDYGVKPSPQVTSAAEQGIAETAPRKQAQDVPSLQQSAPRAKTDSTQAQTSEAIQSAAIETNETIRVSTDEYSLLIDLQGGNIVQADLSKYPVDLKTPEEKVRLFNNSDQLYFVAQSGLQTNNNNAPDHYARYTSAARSYELGNDETLTVPLIWEKEGVTVEKKYIFTRGSHAIKLVHRVKNTSGDVWEGRQYRQLQRDYNSNGPSMFVNAYTGGVVYNEEDKYQKISFDDMEEEVLKANFSNGWAAMIQHYFLAAWIPEENETNHYYTNVIEQPYSGNRYVLGLVSPQQTIQNGESAQFETTLFLGPKIQKELEATAKGLVLTVDYTFLTFIAQPLYWLLDKIHSFLGNWGWSIIVLTILIKLAFYKLSEASYKSMAKMRKVTPKLTALRERYKDDRQRQSTAMMELYKKEKINPLGGCLPMLIQIPVFIALYWVLLESVEMRQAPFMLWINDLSTKDPYFVLPVIMGITMFIQQKLNPAPTDPIQAKVFMFLPFIFTVFFAFFPSGLVLYWVANNTLTIIQQWFITKKVLAEK